MHFYMCYRIKTLHRIQKMSLYWAIMGIFLDLLGLCWGCLGLSCVSRGLTLAFLKLSWAMARLTFAFLKLSWDIWLSWAILALSWGFLGLYWWSLGALDFHSLCPCISCSLCISLCISMYLFTDLMMQSVARIIIEIPPFNPI